MAFDQRRQCIEYPPHLLLGHLRAGGQLGQYFRFTHRLFEPCRLLCHQSLQFEPSQTGGTIHVFAPCRNPKRRSVKVESAFVFRITGSIQVRQVTHLTVWWTLDISLIPLAPIGAALSKQPRPPSGQARRPEPDRTAAAQRQFEDGQPRPPLRLFSHPTRSVMPITIVHFCPPVSATHPLIAASYTPISAGQALETG